MQPLSLSLKPLQGAAAARREASDVENPGFVVTSVTAALEAQFKVFHQSSDSCDNEWWYLDICDFDSAEKTLELLARALLPLTCLLFSANDLQEPTLVRMPSESSYGACAYQILEDNTIRLRIPRFAQLPAHRGESGLLEFGESLPHTTVDVAQRFICVMMPDRIPLREMQKEAVLGVETRSALAFGEAVPRTESTPQELKRASPQRGRKGLATRCAEMLHDYLTQYIRVLGSITQPVVRICGGVLNSGVVAGVAKGTAEALLLSMRKDGGPLKGQCNVFPRLEDLEIKVAKHDVSMKGSLKYAKFETWSQAHNYGNSVPTAPTSDDTIVVVPCEAPLPRVGKLLENSDAQLIDLEVVVIELRLRTELGFDRWSPRVLDADPTRPHPFETWLSSHEGAVKARLGAVITQLKLVVLQFRDHSSVEAAAANFDLDLSSIVATSQPRLCLTLTDAQRHGTLADLATAKMTARLLQIANNHIPAGTPIGHSTVFIPTVDALALRAAFVDVNCTSPADHANAISEIFDEFRRKTPCVTAGVLVVAESQTLPQDIIAALSSEVKKFKNRGDVLVGVVGRNSNSILYFCNNFTEPIEAAAPVPAPELWDGGTKRRKGLCGACPISEPPVLVQLRNLADFVCVTQDDERRTIPQEGAMVQNFLMGNLASVKDLPSQLYLRAEVVPHLFGDTLCDELRKQLLEPSGTVLKIVRVKPWKPRLMGFTTALNQAVAKAVVTTSQSGDTAGFLDWRPLPQASADLGTFLSKIPISVSKVVIVACTETPVMEEIQNLSVGPGRKVVLVLPSHDGPSFRLGPYLRQEKLEMCTACFKSQFPESSVALDTLRTTASAAAERSEWRWLVHWAIAAKRKKVKPLAAIVDETWGTISHQAADRLTILVVLNLFAPSEVETATDVDVPEIDGIACSDGRTIIHPWIAWLLLEQRCRTESLDVLVRKVLRHTRFQFVAALTIASAATRYASELHLPPLFLLPNKSRQHATDFAVNIMNELVELMRGEDRSVPDVVLAQARCYLVRAQYRCSQKVPEAMSDCRAALRICDEFSEQDVASLGDRHDRLRFQALCVLRVASALGVPHISKADVANQLEQARIKLQLWNDDDQKFSEHMTAHALTLQQGGTVFGELEASLVLDSWLDHIRPEYATQ